MLRWTPLQWTNFVRQYSGTHSSDTSGLQWGNQNLTNWGTIGTNRFTNYVLRTQLALQTNTLSQQAGSYATNRAITDQVPFSNTVVSVSPAADTLYQISVYSGVLCDAIAEPDDHLQVDAYFTDPNGVYTNLSLVLHYPYVFPPPSDIKTANTSIYVKGGATLRVVHQFAPDTDDPAVNTTTNRLAVSVSSYVPIITAIYSP